MTLSFSPPPICRGTMAELVGTGIFLFGGQTTSETSTNQFIGSTYKWNGTSWSQITTTGGPPSARFDHSMSYDGYNLIMVGGTNATNNLLSDTWSLSAAGAWTLQSTTPYSAPTSQRRAAMAFTGASGANVAYLFGGECAFRKGKFVQDLWQWVHGTGWTLLAPTTLPSGRDDTAMASSTSTMLMVGGKNFNGSRQSAFTFNGTNWTQVADLPSARSGMGCVYDSANSKWVVFGGRTLSGEFDNTTYTFNGTSWTTTTPTTSPPGRSNHQMAFDTVNSKVVLFGGLSYGSVMNDTWLYDASTTNGTWTQQ